jgi:hypothetical protein
VLIIIVALDTGLDLGLDLQAFGSHQRLIVVGTALPYWAALRTTLSISASFNLGFDFQAFVEFCYSFHEFVPFGNKYD